MPAPEFVYRLDWETGLIWERTLDRKTIEGLLHTTPQAIYMAGKDAFFMLAVTDGTVETKTGWSGRIIGLENTQEGILLFATDDRVLSGYLLKEGGE
jgi:hypothetical protein